MTRILTVLTLSRCCSTQGTNRQVVHAMFILEEAVDRYKALSEGCYRGVHISLGVCKALVRKMLANVFNDDGEGNVAGGRPLSLSLC